LIVEVVALGTLSSAWRPPRASRGGGITLHVLFVCTGNICRSPTGERLAAAYAAKLGIRGFQASSAGTRAVIGHPIHEKAARVLDELGGDSSDFVARQLSEKLASGADLVLAMTRGHRDQLLGMAPRMLKRTFTLAEASAIATSPGARTIADFPLLRPRTPTESLVDVPDPIGQDAAAFKAVGAQIAALLAPVIQLCARSSID